MRIECKKNEIPIGVRGKGERAYVLCPLESNVLLSVCESCEHYVGVHQMFIPQPRRNSVHKAIEEHSEAEKKWLDDELELAHALMEMYYDC